MLAACQQVTGSNGTTGPVLQGGSAHVGTVPSAGTGRFSTQCSAGQLAVGWGGRVSEATGQHTVSLTITNISTHGCYLSGYPQVALVDRAGRTLPLQYQTTGDQMVTSAPPGHVDILPHALAYVTVNKYRCDTGDLMQATDLWLTPPGLTSPFDVSLAGNVSMDYCGEGDPGSVVHISPIEPDFLATAPR